MHSRYSRTRRRKQPASPDQLELFPEIQLELPFKPEPSKRFNYFEHYLALLSNEYSKPHTKREPQTSERITNV
jgi:hypothetical protein